MATANVTGGSTLSNVLSLAQLLGGGGNQTVTTSKNVSQDAINAAMKKALESTSGLASITGGEKAAGLYNSTVSTQLVNDLMSRVAGEAASQSATTTQTTTGGGMTAGTGLTGLGLLALTDETFRKTAKEGISSLADVLSGLGSGGTMPETANAIYDSVANVSIGELGSYFGDTAEAISTGASVVSDAWDWLTNW